MTPKNRKKLVVAHSTREGAPQHEVETNRALARWLAQILGLKFGGSYNPDQHADRALYLLPTQTLIGAAQARALNVNGPEDLWGGYVDHDFICTKAISHGVLGPDAVTHPAGRHCSASGYATSCSTASAYLPSRMHAKPPHACSTAARFA